MKVDEITYKNRVTQGKKLMSQSSVAICSLVRDCDNSLEKNIPKVEELRKSFKSSEVVVVENDSVDRTKEILASWSKNHKGVTVISNDYGTETIPKQVYKHPKSKFFSRQRIEKMAKYRNIYLDYLKQNASPDYVIMIDLDVYDFDLEGVITSFGFEKKWHSVNANGKKITPESPLRPLFYDTYAFKELNDDDPITYDKLKENQKKYGHLGKKDDLIKVNSGFNGLAIYKWEAIKNLSYKALPNEDEVVLYTCEHVSFHKEMLENGYSIYLNPSMLVNYEKFGFQLYLNKLKEKLGLPKKA